MAEQPRPTDTVLVRNAADPRQVRRADRKTRRREEVYIDALRCVMGTAEGRMVMWNLLEKTGFWRSVFHSHGSVLAYNAGRQDVGHELLKDLVLAGEQLYEEMEREMRAWQRRESQENAAFQAERAAAREQESVTSTEGRQES